MLVLHDAVALRNLPCAGGCAVSDLEAAPTKEDLARRNGEALAVVRDALLWQHTFAPDTQAERRITLLLDVLRAALSGGRMQDPDGEIPASFPLAEHLILVSRLTEERDQAQQKAAATETRILALADEWDLQLNSAAGLSAKYAATSPFARRLRTLLETP